MYFVYFDMVITVCEGITNIGTGGVVKINTLTGSFIAVSHQTSFHAINLHSDCTEQALMSTQEDT